MKTLFKFWKKGKSGYTIRCSEKTQRMYHLLGREKWEKAYIKVTYGKMKDVNGKMVTAYNDGHYTSKREARKALKAFIDEGNEWEGGEN